MIATWWLVRPSTASLFAVVNSSREPSSRRSCRAVLLTARQRLEVLRRVPPSAVSGQECRPRTLCRRSSSSTLVSRVRRRCQPSRVVRQVVACRQPSGSKSLVRRLAVSPLDVDRRRQPSRCRETAVRTPTNSLVNCFRSRPASWTVVPGTSSLSGAVVRDSSRLSCRGQSFSLSPRTSRARLSGHTSELYTVL